MVNQNFKRFVKAQEKEESIYLRGAKRAKNLDPKANSRGNTDKSVGASGRDID
ncbi:hypothetical protein HNQ94_000275 [Salirhabdus euzebyi]|uniref:Uncharacterized protein n=1 Tax=Salirhabdus euzebyi TaxID=394506 RepID=A0A841PVT2_9BACI|nr:hypothetical protein [Salirhabdus euzebyi]MBB6451854.1 hypothetical protein [Salirhabdus euzebyi]